MKSLFVIALLAVSSTAAAWGTGPITGLGNNYSARPIGLGNNFAPAPRAVYQPRPSYTTQPNIYGGTDIRDNVSGSTLTGTPNIYGGQDWK